MRAWRHVFLTALAHGASVTEACRLAGVSRQHAYRCRARSSSFAQQWLDAQEEGTDALEDEATRRAFAGSDTLLMFLLKARRPEKYRDGFRVQHDVGQQLMEALQRAAEEVATER